MKYNKSDGGAGAVDRVPTGSDERPSAIPEVSVIAKVAGCGAGATEHIGEMLFAQSGGSSPSLIRL